VNVSAASRMRLVYKRRRCALVSASVAFRDEAPATHVQFVTMTILSLYDSDVYDACSRMNIVLSNSATETNAKTISQTST